MTEYVLKKGEIVVATLRRPSDLSDLLIQYPASQLLILECDVRNYEQVRQALEKTVETFGACHIVFNNAGVGMLAEAEGTPYEAAKYLFDINFWGATNVCREAVRVFRDLNGKDAAGNHVGGLLLNMSSIMSFIGLPGLSYYAAR